MGPDVDWTPAAGHLLGYQAPEPALLAMDLCLVEFHVFLVGAPLPMI